MKFAHVYGDDPNAAPPGPVRWNDIFERESEDWGERLKIGVSDRQIDLMRQLSTRLTPPFKVLYVLIVARGGAGEEGRYELDERLDRASTDAFLTTYGVMFEGDGRHALWVQSDDGLVVYTPHDLIWAYGPLDAFQDVLEERGFQRREFDLSFPHAHIYHERYDELSRSLLAAYPWTRYPLQEMDDQT